MNVLFLTIAYDSTRNIYSDLMNEFRANGHVVYVVCQTERRHGQETYVREENGIHILRVKTGNITGKVSLIEKGLTTLLIEYLFKKAISTYLSDVKFDIMLYSTPPITFSNVVKYVRERDGAATYLLLKDIFPQNAVDLGLLKENSIIYKMFRKKEKNLYKLSDYIGCMSEANKKYLFAHNSDIDIAKVEINTNTIKPLSYKTYERDHVSNIRSKYDIPENATVFIYGGNLGLPQGLEFIVDVCREIKDRHNIFILIVGDGNKYTYVAEELTRINTTNVRLIKRLPKAEYDELLTACDVGLIFLSPKFTIPNFPSRLTAYMEMGLPVLAATDTVTDINDAIADADCGYWSESGDLDTFVRNMETLATDCDMRRRMGQNGRKYLEDHYTVDKSYQKIMSHFTSKEAPVNVH